VIEHAEIDNPGPGLAEDHDARPGPVGHDAHEPMARAAVWTKADLIVAALVTVAFLLVYLPELRWLSETWVNDANYSHGFLVLPVAVVILWRRLTTVDSRLTRSRPVWWVWLPIAALLTARIVLYERGSDWTDAFTFLLLIPCLMATLGGWALLRYAWPACAYLIFMFPLPSGVNDLLSGPLQSLATTSSVGLLKLTGLWVIAEGNVIIIDNQNLEVAEACNGLSMLMTLAATITAMTVLFPMAKWKRIVLLLSIAPVALLSNVIRIASTAWCYHAFGPKFGTQFAHDWAGWLMMPLALMLPGLELFALRFLVVEEAVRDEPTLLGRPISRTVPRAELGRPSQVDQSSSPPATSVSPPAAPAPESAPTPSP
jgi:exosortase